MSAAFNKAVDTMCTFLKGVPHAPLYIGPMNVEVAQEEKMKQESELVSQLMLECWRDRLQHQVRE